MKEKMEEFIELFTPLSNVKLLSYILLMFRRGKREFTMRDLVEGLGKMERGKGLHEWTIFFALKRLREKGVVKLKRVIPSSLVFSCGGVWGRGRLINVYELNIGNELVQKLIELFEAVEREARKEEEELAGEIRDILWLLRDEVSEEEVRRYVVVYLEKSK